MKAQKLINTGRSVQVTYNSEGSCRLTQLHKQPHPFLFDKISVHGREILQHPKVTSPAASKLYSFFFFSWGGGCTDAPAPQKQLFFALYAVLETIGPRK